MDQLRLDFKLNFFFLKNLKLNIFYYTYFIHPIEFIDFLYPSADYVEADWFNKNDLRKIVVIDNSIYVPKKIFYFKKIKCKKIFTHKKRFINLLYF